MKCAITVITIFPPWEYRPAGAQDELPLAPRLPDFPNHVDERSGPAELRFANGHFIRLLAVEDKSGELGRWSASGEPLTDEAKEHFAGVAQSQPDRSEKTSGKQIHRSFVVACNLPEGTLIETEVGGWSGHGILRSASDDMPNVAHLTLTQGARFPSHHKSTDLKIAVTLPNWKTIARFGTGGGFHNGITLKQTVSSTTRTYTATGDFDSRAGGIRFIVEDYDHQPLEATQSGTVDGKNSRWMVTLDRRQSFRQLFVQQRRPGQVLVFDNIALYPESKPGASKTLPLAWVLGDLGAKRPINLNQDEQSLEELFPVPRKKYEIKLDEKTTLRVLRLTSSPFPGHWWTPDGSATFPSVQPTYPKDFKASDEDQRFYELQCQVEIQDESMDPVQINSVDVRFSGAVSGTQVAFQPPRIRAPDQQSVKINRSYAFFENETEEQQDFEITIATQPWQDLGVIPIVERPVEFESSLPFRFNPKRRDEPWAFATMTDDELKTKNQKLRTFYAFYPTAPGHQFRVVALTEDGEIIPPTARTHEDGGQQMAMFPIEFENYELLLQFRPQHEIALQNVALRAHMATAPTLTQRNTPSSEGSNSKATPVQFFRSVEGQLIGEPQNLDAIRALNRAQQAGAVLTFDRRAKKDEKAALTRITWENCDDADLQALEWVKGLSKLTLNSKRLTDSGLVSIESLSELTDLNIRNNRQLTTQCLHSVGELRSLQRLEIDGVINAGTPEYQASDFDALAKLSQLRSISLTNWDVDDRSLQFIDQLPDLSMLYCSGKNVTDQTFQKLAAKPSLSVLCVFRCQASDATFKALENSASLYWLEISGPSVTDASIESVLKMPRIRDVSFSRSQLTDRGMDRLITGLDQLKSLRGINLQRTRVTESGLRRLKKARPSLQISHSLNVELD